MSVRLTEKSVVVKPPHTVRAADPDGDLRVTASEIPPKPNGRWRWFVVAAAVLGIGAGVVLARAFLAGKSATGEDSTGGNGQSNRRASLGFVGGNGAGGGRERRRGVPLRHRARRSRAASDTLRLTGSLIADERSSVASNTSGIAAEVFVDRGSVVQKGDVLVQIDPTDAKNKLAEGQAMIDELKARLGIDGTCPSSIPRTQPEVRLAKASADLAASNLNAPRTNSPRKSSRPKPTIRRGPSTSWLRSAIVSRCSKSSRRIRCARRRRPSWRFWRRTWPTRRFGRRSTVGSPRSWWPSGEQISSGMQATKVVTLVRIDPLRLSLTVPQQDIGRDPSRDRRSGFGVDSFPDRVFEAHGAVHRAGRDQRHAVDGRRGDGAESRPRVAARPVCHGRGGTSEAAAQRSSCRSAPCSEPVTWAACSSSRRRRPRTGRCVG